MNSQPDPFKNYRPWFYAASIYNLVWGVGVIFAPNLGFQLLNLSPPNYPVLFQCIGMMVMVYGLGYYYLARDPEKYANYIWIAIAGKTFGPIGFLYAVLTNQLPPAFGITILFNDILWWPAFWSFALKHARDPFLKKPTNP